MKKTTLLLTLLFTFSAFAEDMTPEKFKQMRSKVADFKSIGKAKFPYKIKGFKSPESVLQTKDGTVYISEINAFGMDGDGQITKISRNGKMSVYAKNLDDPKGLVMVGNTLYVADKTKILEVNPDGTYQVFVDAKAFPKTPQFLNDLEADPQGNLYVSDSGDIMGTGKGGAVYKIDKDKAVTTVVDSSNPEVMAPNGLWFEGRNNLLEVDFTSGTLYRINLATHEMTKLADGFGGGDGLVKTKAGKILVSDWKNGVINQVSAGKARLVYDGLTSSADIAISSNGKYLLVPLMKPSELEILELK